MNMMLKEIKSSGSKRKILARFFNCTEEEISFSKEEWIKSKKDIVYHYGDLNLEEYDSLDGVILPKIIDGNLNLSGYKDKEIDLSRIVVKGFVNLENIDCIEKLDLSNKRLINFCPKKVKMLNLNNSKFDGNLLSILEEVVELNIANAIIVNSINLTNLKKANFIDMKNINVEGDIRINQDAVINKIVFPK